MANAPTTSSSALLVVHGHRDGHAVGGATHISQECVARVRRGERLVRELGVHQVLFCGAGAPGHPSEARQMAGIWGGPPVCAFLDERSTDSAENAHEALQWMRTIGVTQLIVVSSWWHIRLLAYYSGRQWKGVAVRHARAWRWDRPASHIAHELRYLPLAFRLRARAQRAAEPSSHFIRLSQ